MQSLKWRGWAIFFRHVVITMVGGANLAGLQAQASEQPRFGQQTIQGHVRESGGRPIAGATVIVTMAPDRISLQTESDSSGSFELRFTSGTGDYLIYVAAPGFAAYRKRSTIVPPDTVLIVEAKLEVLVTTMPTVTATARRNPPIPDAGRARDVAGSETYANSIVGMLDPFAAGDVRALALSHSSFALGPDGSLTAFGLPGQVNVTLNGMEFEGATLPRGMRTQVRATSTAYDPAIGGFGGARINVEFSPGYAVREANMGVVYGGPALQLYPRTRESLLSKHSRVGVSADGSGPIGTGQFRFNAAIDASRDWGQAESMIDAGIGNSLGVSPDTIQRFVRGLSMSGVPVDRRLTALRSTERLTAAGQLEHRAPRSRTAFTASAVLSALRSSEPAFGGLTLGSGSNSTSQLSGQAIGSVVRGGLDMASDLTISVSATQNASKSAMSLPSIQVGVNSVLDGEIGPVHRVLAAGGSTPSPSSTRFEVDGVANLIRNIGVHHAAKVHGRAAIDAYRLEAAQDLGVFTFESIDAFSRNAPASFSRRRRTDVPLISQFRGTLAVGDIWQPTARLKLQGGVRVDGNAFNAPNSLNQGLVYPRGVASNALPSASLGISPRIGFAWTLARSVEATPLSGSSTVGRLWLPALGVLSGGIGEFRQDLTADRVARSVFPTSAMEVTCFSGATPVPDWEAILRDPSTAPSHCTGPVGQPGTSARDAIAFAPDFKHPQSWRGNLKWAGDFRDIRYSLDGVASYNIHQPSILDRNFSDAAYRTIAGDGARPLYIDPATIDLATGLVSARSSRVDDTIARALLVSSTARSVSRQLTATVVPPFRRGLMQVAYTLGTTRRHGSGFDDVTFGSPVFLRDSRSASDIRHTLVVSGGLPIWRGITLSGQARAISGLPYSPTIDRDVNGDGFANDLAFLPGASDTSALGNELRSLLAASRGARDCLAPQLGRAAGAWSCSGPWTLGINAALAKAMTTSDGRRVSVVVNLVNPLGGIDRILHGDKLHGWGNAGRPDPVLYHVTGFDPASQAFRYAVNPTFGSMRRQGGSFGAFGLTIDASIELGTPVEEGLFRRFRAAAPNTRVFEPAPADSLRRRLSILVPNYYDELLRATDSLLLVPEQIAALRSGGADFRIRANAVWQELAGYIVSVGDRYRMQDMRERRLAATARVWAIQREELPRMLASLTPAQRILAKDMLKPLAESGERPPPSPVVF